MLLDYQDEWTCDGSAANYDSHDQWIGGHELTEPTSCPGSVSA
jgi:hypothetical protein